MSDEWVPTVEAARLLGVSETSVRRWIYAGKLPSKREGRLLFVQVPPQPDITGMVTVEDAVKVTSLNRTKLYALIRSGRLPAVRFGNYLRVHPADLEAYVEAHRVQPRRLASGAPRAKRGHTGRPRKVR